MASAAFLRTPAFDLHLATDTAVAFSSTDFYLPDNAGGISLAITPVAVPTASVPEPSEILLLLLALPLAVCLRRSSLTNLWRILKSLMPKVPLSSTASAFS